MSIRANTDVSVSLDETNIFITILMSHRNDNSQPLFKIVEQGIRSFESKFETYAKASIQKLPFGKECCSTGRRLH